MHFCLCLAGVVVLVIVVLFILLFCYVLLGLLCSPDPSSVGVSRLSGFLALVL